jgi:dTDP-4-amino-4,6-dideoxygalactose transaminase
MKYSENRPSSSVNKVLINDLARHTASLGTEIREAVERVIASGWYVLGSECSAFEREFAAYCGTASCVSVANGTDALELAFRALNLEGKRVATVANAGFYTSTALHALRATPVYVDVGDDHLMDLNELARITKAGKADAVVITHLFGLMHDMEAVRAITTAAGLPVIEDCAQAHGAERNSRRAGSQSDAATFSFYPTKNLGALGDGGAVVTGNAQVDNSLRLIRQYGWESKYRVAQLGARNSRLDEVQAAVLRAKLPRLGVWNARRRDIATRYSQGIRNPRVRTPPAYGPEYVAHLYVVTCADRDALRHHLGQSGISCDVHYPVPDHLQPATSSKDHPHLPRRNAWLA